MSKTTKSATNVKEGNHFGPIWTSHNSNTHTELTRQSKSQLKECSFSFAIPNHNSRDAIPSHNSKNTTCLPSIPSHNLRDNVPSHHSRNTLASRSLRYHPYPCRPRTCNAYKSLTSALSLGATLESLGEQQFQTAWWMS